MIFEFEWPPPQPAMAMLGWQQAAAATLGQQQQQHIAQLQTAKTSSGDPIQKRSHRKTYLLRFVVHCTKLVLRNFPLTFAQEKYLLPKEKLFFLCFVDHMSASQRVDPATISKIYFYTTDLIHKSIALCNRGATNRSTVYNFTVIEMSSKFVTTISVHTYRKKFPGNWDFGWWLSQSSSKVVMFCPTLTPRQLHNIVVQSSILVPYYGRNPKNISKKYEAFSSRSIQIWFNMSIKVIYWLEMQKTSIWVKVYVLE